MIKRLAKERKAFFLWSVFRYPARAERLFRRKRICRFSCVGARTLTIDIRFDRLPNESRPQSTLQLHYTAF